MIEANVDSKHLMYRCCPRHQSTWNAVWFNHNKYGPSIFFDDHMKEKLEKIKKFRASIIYRILICIRFCVFLSIETDKNELKG